MFKFKETTINLYKHEFSSGWAKPLTNKVPFKLKERQTRKLGQEFMLLISITSKPLLPNDAIHKRLQNTRILKEKQQIMFPQKLNVFDLIII